jgi:hypothetical protein
MIDLAEITGETNAQIAGRYESITTNSITAASKAWEAYNELKN